MTGSEREALIAWSAVAEPGDETAGAIVDLLGARGALEWLDSARRRPVDAVAELTRGASPTERDAIARALDRWSRRVDLAAAPHEQRARAVGATVLTRHDDGWPRALDDLGPTTPFALYVRGTHDLDGLWRRSAAVVGSRACTSYGVHMAGELAAAAASVGAVVVSGGAYGIDAVAHRTALAEGGRTLAVMAGGVDRLYPAANEDILREAIVRGAVVSEVPPGFAPHRSRFLSRNRLIAAASATVVVEAAVRSGALSTARHAAGLLRPVGAVPGPATSAASAGCHDLIRESLAVLIGSARDALELLMSAPEWAQFPPEEAAQGAIGILDFDTPHERALYDSASSRARELDSLARDAGLDLRAARAALGSLAARGVLEPHRGGWRRARGAQPKRA